MKRHLVYLIAVLAYYTGIVSLFYRLNRRTKRIITFHNVLPEGILPDGKKIGIVDTEIEFRHKIREICRRFQISNDFADSETATITFDDGYHNQWETVGKVLNEEGKIPAVVFISGKLFGCDNSSGALVIDKLMHWVELAPAGKYMLSGSANRCFDLTDDNRREIWQNLIWKEFRKDSGRKGEQLLACLDEQYSMDEIFRQCDKQYLRLRLTGINRQDIESMRQVGWQVGWHSYSHYPLSMLSMTDLHSEFASAPEFMLQVPMSFPYGEMESVNHTVIDCCKKAGFPAAVSNLPDPTLLSGKYFLPRFTLDSNRYILHFELSGFKYFLRSGHLLPDYEF